MNHIIDLNENEKESINMILYWLQDMALFYDNLVKFVMKLPLDTNKKNMISYNNHMDKDFENFFKLSDQMSTYNMPNIPSSCKHILAPALRIVQDMSREAFIKVSLHPTFSNFTMNNEQRPFFEKAMINGSCIAVEYHDIINLSSGYNEKIQNNMMIKNLNVEIENIRNDMNILPGPRLYSIAL